MNLTKLTRAELELALRQQQAENAALQAQLAQVQVATGLPPGVAGLLGLLMEKQLPAVVVTNAAGYVTWVSKEFTALCGIEPFEILGQIPGAFLRLYLPEGPMRAYVEENLQAKTAFQYEVPNPRRPGRWLRGKVQPVCDEQHEVTHLVGMLEDITEWKESQAVLSVSEQRFQVLTENVPGVLYEWRLNHDGTFHFNYVSPKLHELFGVPLQNCNQVLEYVHPDDLPGVVESIQIATAARLPWAAEGRVVVPSQPPRWFQGKAVLTAEDETGVVYSGLLLDTTPLKLAEAALRERDLRWRLATEGFGDGTWELNLHTGQIFFSTDYKAMIGYTNAEFADEYANWLAHVHPEDLGTMLQAVADYKSGLVAMTRIEYRIRCQDGTYKCVLSRAIVTERNAAGEALVLTGAHTDISALRTAQEAHHAADRRLSTVIANFQEGLLLEDQDRRIVLANDTLCQLLGMATTPAQLTGKDGAWLVTEIQDSLLHPQHYGARIAGLLKHKVSVSGDLLLLRDGRVIQRDFTPIYEQNRYIGHLWKYQDVTTRNKAETDLRRREEKYRGIIENMSMGLVEADLDDHLLYANQSFCDMTGFGIEDLAGRRLSPVLLSGEDLELVESKLASRQRGVADSYEIRVTTKSGETKWLMVSGAPLYDDAQQHIGSIGIYLDVTSQKHLEANLREAMGQAESSSRVKQEFLANMSHEIRTPMNAIVGMSQLLAKTPLDGVQASYLHAIRTSAENLLVIINDILDLSKIEAGRMRIEHIGFEPARLLAQIAESLRYQAQEKGLALTIAVAPDVPPVVLGDPYRITQILLNLVGNSVKFTDKGSVSLTCTLLQTLPTEAVQLEFKVSDTGIGMEADYLAQVFDNFSQEDNSVTRKFGGTGLGLGISKKLLELLGSTLQIESLKNWGTTSRFVLALPAGTPADLPCRDSDNGAGLNTLRRDLRGKRVLLVEDNLFNRMLATVFLTNTELHVTEAANGQVAVELARHQPFDLVLMDLQMPVMDGYEATAVLRQQLGLRVPIIALTANAITGERAKCLAGGMNDYLTKPFQEIALIQVVHQWITASPPPVAALP